jgi:hypothetical protein
MREAGASYKVAKNRLAKLAIENTDYVGIGDMLTGPVGLAFGRLPVAAAKAAVEFAKTNDKLEIVGGAMGSQVLDEAGIKALASMPSPRRTARQAHRPGQGTGDEDRPARYRSGGQAGPRLRRLRGQGSRIRDVFRQTKQSLGRICPATIWSEPSWPISPSLLKNFRS